MSKNILDALLWLSVALAIVVGVGVLIVLFAWMVGFTVIFLLEIPFGPINAGFPVELIVGIGVIVICILTGAKVRVR